MNTDRVNATLRHLWPTLARSSAVQYRAAWRNWVGYTSNLGLDPLRVTVPIAQDWVNHLARRYAPATVRNTVKGARCCLEYLAMMGHRPYEPLLVVVVSTVDIRPPRQRRPEPTVPLLVKGMRSAYGHDRATAILWAAAGMGLAVGEIAALSKPGKVRNTGTVSLAVIHRAGKTHLIPIPREMLAAVAHSGWPIRPGTPQAAATAARKAMAPHLTYTVGECRSLHQVLADAVVANGAPIRAVSARWRYSDHPSVAVCEHLRSLLASG